MDTPKNLYYERGGVYGGKGPSFQPSVEAGCGAAGHEQGMPVGKVARDLDIHPNLLHLWRRKFLAEGDKAFIGKGRVAPEEAEIRRLRKELERVKEERDILKKAVAFSRRYR